MADYVTHDLHVVRGNPEALRQFLSQDGTGLFLDFNKLVSMPDDIRGVLNGSMAINGYAALFGDWTTLGYPGQFSSREQAIVHVGQRLPGALDVGCACKHNLDTHGAMTENDWAESHWGTTSNGMTTVIDSDDLSRMTFETAWSVPLSVFEALAKALPSHVITINSTYEDGDDMGHTVLAYGQMRQEFGSWRLPVGF